MIWYVKGLEIPSHLERQYLLLRSDLIRGKTIIPYPYIPMVVMQFSSVPLTLQKKEKYYLVDMLGEGGLVMDQLIEQDGLLYWSSSRINLLNWEIPPSVENLPFSQGKGILLGKIMNEAMKMKDLSYPITNWKKASVIYREIDFSPQRMPGEREYWPRAVSWKNR